jgi:hypothetical protein
MVKKRLKVYDEVEVFYESGTLYYCDVNDLHYKGGYKGHAMVTKYYDGNNTLNARIAFIPNRYNSEKSPAVVNFSEVNEGLNADLHPAMAVRLRDEDNEPASAVFGKAASVTYSMWFRGHRKAVRTWWAIKFRSSLHANNFVIVVEHLASKVGQIKQVDEEQQGTEADEAAADAKEVDAKEEADAKEEVDAKEEADFNEEAHKDFYASEAAELEEEADEESDDDFVAQTQDLFVSRPRRSKY